MKKLICVLLPFLLLLACLPTPTEEVIANKADGKLESAIVAPPVEPEQQQEQVAAIPSEWKEELEIRGRKVHIDASIEFQAAEGFSILTIKNRAFDAKEVVSFLKGLLGDELTVRQNEYSREEVLYMMRHVARGRIIDYDENDMPIYGPYEGQEADFAKWNEIMLETPDEDIFVPFDESTLKFPCEHMALKNAEGELRYVNWRSESGIFVYRDPNTMVQPQSYIIFDGGYSGEGPRILEDPAISEAEAKALADAYMARIGRPDMQMGAIEKARILTTMHDELAIGYRLVYTSTSGGATAFAEETSRPYFLGFTEMSIEDILNSANEEPWHQESASLFINEDGILHINWQYPKEIVAVANERAELMPFEQIQNSIRNYLEFGINENWENEDIYLYRMVLSTSIQRIPNQMDEAFLTPTWYVMFDTDHLKKIQGMPKAMLPISALDGTYVEKIG